jgi:hypothetical protein
MFGQTKLQKLQKLMWYKLEDNYKHAVTESLNYSAGSTHICGIQNV